jgi:hypothetical protein
MPEHLFRFRTIHALLDSRHELEHQEIYFSPPEQLNDPLEGFKDIFWQGDAIVWTNLLRHYLLCLMQATSITMVAGKDFTPTCVRGSFTRPSTTYQRPRSEPSMPRSAMTS